MDHVTEMYQTTHVVGRAPILHQMNGILSRSLHSGNVQCTCWSLKKKQNKFLSKRNGHKLTEILSLTALIKTILNASIRRGIWVPMLVTYFALAFFVSFVHSLWILKHNQSWKRCLRYFTQWIFGREATTFSRYYCRHIEKIEMRPGVLCF